MGLDKLKSPVKQKPAIETGSSIPPNTRSLVKERKLMPHPHSKPGDPNTKKIGSLSHRKKPQIPQTLSPVEGFSVTMMPLNVQVNVGGVIHFIVFRPLEGSTLRPS